MMYVQMRCIMLFKLAYISNHLQGYLTASACMVNLSMSTVTQIDTAALQSSFPLPYKVNNSPAFGSPMAGIQSTFGLNKKKKKSTAFKSE